MSAAVVSGGVALLLDGEPGLTPAQVKVALQTGAQFLPEAGLIGGGAGSVDFCGVAAPRAQAASWARLAARR